MTDQEFSDERRKWLEFERIRPAHIERPGPGQESVWDYPRPPKVERVNKPLKVILNDVVIAETDHGLRVIETSSPPQYYFPPNDVQLEYFQRTSQRSLCEWKGQAGYWNIRVGDKQIENGAWSYESPFVDIADYSMLKSYLAFYVRPMDSCWVGDEQVEPQPGEFYGGWVTSNLTGPFKGEPGSEGW